MVTGLLMVAQVPLLLVPFFLLFPVACGDSPLHEWVLFGSLGTAALGVVAIAASAILTVDEWWQNRR